jgi:hypothetical protein
MILPPRQVSAANRAAVGPAPRLSATAEMARAARSFCFARHLHPRLLMMKLYCDSS